MLGEEVVVQRMYYDFFFVAVENTAEDVEWYGIQKQCLKQLFLLREFQPRQQERYQWLKITECCF